MGGGFGEEAEALSSYLQPGQAAVHCFRPSVSSLGELCAFSGSMEPKKQRVWANAPYFLVV